MYRQLLTLVVALIWTTSLHRDARADEKVSYIVRPVVYEALKKIEDARQAGKFNKAIKDANIVLKRLRPSDHERAKTLQVLAFTYAAQERMGLATKTLEDAYKLNALPPATQNNILYVLGQLLLGVKNYKGAVKYFDRWLAVIEAPAPSALYTVGATKYQAGDIEGAIALTSRAVKASKNPKEAWYRLLASSYITLKRYKPAIKVYAKLIEAQPKRRSDWIQLVALYSEVKDDKRALATLQLAKRMGVFERKDDYMQLAQRFQSQDLPLPAGRMLEGSVSKSKLKLDPEVAELIATSFYMARDRDKAVPALGRAAAIAENGELYLLLTQLELENENWPKAIDAGKKAVRKGGLRWPGNAHYFIGVAETRRGRNAAAIAAFEIASKTATPQYAKAAKGWIKHLSSVSAKN